MKYAIILGDGMADYPIEELGNKTPLEYASHPAMDRIAQNGTVGLAYTIPKGLSPGSDIANLSVLGYDPRAYYSGRSPLEAVSLGIELKETDVSYRMNIVTLTGDTLEEAVMSDYCAGEITTEESDELISLLKKRFYGRGIDFHTGLSYRNVLVIHDGQEGAECTPPHDISGRNTKEYLPKGVNSALIREIEEYSYSVFKQSALNRRRRETGQNEGNAVWIWGEGRRPALPSFKEKTGLRGGMISAVDLLRGIAKCAGMKIIGVAGATGNKHTDFAAKGQKCVDALKNGCEFVYVHVEATDECSHQGDIEGKVYSIEQIDRHVVRPVLEYLEGCGEDFAVMTLPDHYTPLSLRTHTGDPVPFALWRGKCENNTGAKRYTEAYAKETGLIVSEGSKLTDMMINGF